MEIARQYLKQHKRFTNKLPSYSRIQESKWWPYFLKCAVTFGNNKEWDTYKFIEAQFEIKGDIYPFDLAKREAWEIYLEYRKRDKNFEIYIARNLLATYEYIKKWSKGQGYAETNYKKYFNDPKERLYIKRQNLPFYFFSILRSFYDDFYNKLTDEEKDSLIEVEELMKLRAAVYTNEKIKEKMRQILGSEFV